MSEYFVKHSFGTMRHFCHNSRGICFCNILNGQTGEYESLVGNGQKDFDVIIDDAETIHMVCQDDAGNILYIKTEGMNWEKYTLLQSKSYSPHQKHFRLFRVGNLINILYAIDYKGKKLLTHHILETSDVPDAVDCFEGEFAATKDENGNLYVVYESLGGVLGWRKYTWSKKVWEDFVPVSTSGRLIHPYIYADEKIHITGVVDNTVVSITQEAEIKVGEGGSRPVFIKSGNSLYVMWENKREGRVWASVSNNGGATFQNPTEFMAGRFSPIKLFGLAYTSFESCQSRHCYGYIKDNIASLYVLSDFMKISMTPPKPAMPQGAAAPPVRQEGDAVELTKLKIQLQGIHDSLTKLGSRIDMLDKRVKGLETPK